MTRRPPCRCCACRARALPLLLATLVTFALMALPAAAAQKQQLRVGGEVRSYYLVPPAGPRPAPAVVVLHGAAGTGLRMQRITRFTLASRGWAEIYPEGLGRRWNDGRTTSDGRPLAEADDVGFLRALIVRLAGEGLIDPRRVYFAGISNGGAMIMRLICETPEIVAGAAIVAMTLPERLDCPDGPPVPVLLIHGTADPLIPYEGGPARVPGGADRGRVRSARATAAFFAVRNRCGPFETIMITDHFPEDGTRVRLHTYRDCAAPVLHYIVEGGGHTWPGNRNRRRIEKILGRTSRDISATFEIEAFFTSLARR